MAGHPNHPEWLEVNFVRQALEGWGIAFPEMPAADEFVLWMKLEPCSECGKEHHGELGAIDPKYVTAEGLLVGPQLCSECLVVDK